MGGDPGGSYERLDGNDWEPATKPNSAFSPPAIGLVAVIACAFLIVTYYRYFLKYCKPCLWRIGSRDEDEVVVQDSDGLQISTSRTFGLEEAVMKKLPVCVFRKGENLLIEGTECAVCLLEFEENEILRILPKCTHAFHIGCIDMWLSSHANCPLCRSNVVGSDISITLPPPPAPSPVVEPNSAEEIPDRLEDHRDVAEIHGLQEVKSSSLEKEEIGSTTSEHRYVRQLSESVILREEVLLRPPLKDHSGPLFISSCSSLRDVSPRLISMEQWSNLSVIVLSPMYPSGESTSRDRANTEAQAPLERSYRLERVSP